MSLQVLPWDNYASWTMWKMPYFMRLVQHWPGYRLYHLWVNLLLAWRIMRVGVWTRILQKWHYPNLRLLRSYLRHWWNLHRRRSIRLYFLWYWWGITADVSNIWFIMRDKLRRRDVGRNRSESVPRMRTGLQVLHRVYIRKLHKWVHWHHSQSNQKFFISL